MGISKNRGGKPPKMDGENKASKPYEQMDDLGGFPIIFGLTPMSLKPTRRQCPWSTPEPISYDTFNPICYSMELWGPYK